MSVIQVNGVLKARKSQKTTVSTTALGLTSTNFDVTDAYPAGNTDTKWKVLRAEEVLITVEAQPIRWTIDGTTPTVTAGTGLGHVVAAGGSLTITGYDNIKAFQMIREGGTDAVIQATFFFRQ